MDSCAKVTASNASAARTSEMLALGKGSPDEPVVAEDMKNAESLLTNAVPVAPGLAPKVVELL